MVEDALTEFYMVFLLCNTHVLSDNFSIDDLIVGIPCGYPLEEHTECSQSVFDITSSSKAF